MHPSRVRPSLRLNGVAFLASCMDMGAWAAYALESTYVSGLATDRSGQILSSPLRKGVEDGRIEREVLHWWADERAKDRLQVVTLVDDKVEA